MKNILKAMGFGTLTLIFAVIAFTGWYQLGMALLSTVLPFRYDYNLTYMLVRIALGVTLTPFGLIMAFVCIKKLVNTPFLRTEPAKEVK